MAVPRRIEFSTAEIEPVAPWLVPDFQDISRQIRFQGRAELVRRNKIALRVRLGNA